MIGCATLKSRVIGHIVLLCFTVLDTRRKVWFLTDPYCDGGDLSSLNHAYLKIVAVHVLGVTVAVTVAFVLSKQFSCAGRIPCEIGLDIIPVFSLVWITHLILTAHD